MNPTAVLIYVPDVKLALGWYQKDFPDAAPIYHSEFDFTVLDLDGFFIEIVQADKKVGFGIKGLLFIGR
ncbi:hypothetical protein PSSHI_33160 [Photobacterium sp. R1]